MKKLLQILLYFSVALSFAQKEAANWYFGTNAGLDFNTGVPVALLNGKLVTDEGCATISDPNGVLLFYTDGTTVWDANHNVMPNGNGLKGDISSTQSALIVPKPNSNTIYYIFTADSASNPPINGINYYTVDMTLNGGFGAVLGNNGNPTANEIIAGQSTEKLTAIQAADGNSFWVISQQGNDFYAFKVDNNGVQQPAVISNPAFLPIDWQGALKLSPDGTLLAAAFYNHGGSIASNKLFLFDFNTINGTISNPRQLSILGEKPYGLEFSPQSKKLYVTTGDFVPGDGPIYDDKLYEFDLDIPNLTAANINATRVLIHSYKNTRSALQLALDGKIYRTVDNGKKISVINNPEGLDNPAVGYQHEVVDLGGKEARQGLPPFIQSYFSASINAKFLCFGDTTEFSVQSTGAIVNYLWDFGDGSPVSILANPTHVYGAVGLYTVQVTVTAASGLITIYTKNIEILNVPIVSDVSLNICDADADSTDGITDFDLTTATTKISVDPNLLFTYYLTQADALTGNIALAIANPTAFSNGTANKVYARVENKNGCFSIAKVTLVVATVNLPTTFIIPYAQCDNDGVIDGITSFDFSDATQLIKNQFPANQNLVIQYYPSNQDANNKTNEILNLAAYKNTISPNFQDIYVRIENPEDISCIGIGNNISLTVNPIPQFELLDTIILCLNNLPLTVSSSNPQGNYNYQWQDENGTILGNQPTIDITKAGTYTLTATTTDGTNCTNSKSIVATASNIATITNTNIIDNSTNNTITIEVSGEGDYEFALDDITGPYRDNNVFTNLEPGLHFIYINDKNGCGIVSKQISIIGVENFFTPNGDGINDTWQIKGVSFQPNSKIYIFNRYGKVITKLDPLGKGWDGLYNGKPLPSTDYWYKAILDDGRILKGHFSLIRK